MSTTSVPAPRRHRLGAWFALSLVLATATALVLAWWVGPEQVQASVRSMSRGWLAAAVGAELLAVACLARVQAAAFRVTSGRLPAREAAAIALGSFSLSQLLPAGGAAGGVFAVHRLSRRTDGATATTTVLVASATSLACLGLVVTTGVGAAAALGSGSARVATTTGIGTAGLVGAVAVLLGLLRDPSRRARMVAAVAHRLCRDEATQQGWVRALDRQARVLRRPRRLLPVAGWSVLAWSFDVAVLAAVAEAVGLDVSLPAIVAAYGVGNLANAVPVTPGGIGLVEAGITGALVALGAEPGPAAVVALGYRLVGDLLPVVVAVPVLAMAGRDGPAGSSGHTSPRSDRSTAGPPTDRGSTADAGPVPPVTGAPVPSGAPTDRPARGPDVTRPEPARSR